jgi:hypothetical protein
MKSMDVYELKPGDKVRTMDGAVAEILNETQDGQWIKVRYVESDEDPSIVGTLPLAPYVGDVIGRRRSRRARGNSISVINHDGLAHGKIGRASGCRSRGPRHCQTHAVAGRPLALCSIMLELF